MNWNCLYRQFQDYKAKVIMTPKFKVGDRIINAHEHKVAEHVTGLRITKVTEDMYYYDILYDNRTPYKHRYNIVLLEAEGWHLETKLHRALR